MEKQERGGACDEPTVGFGCPADGGGQRTRNRVEPINLVFIPHRSFQPDLSHLPPAASEGFWFEWHPGRFRPSRSRGQPSSRYHRQATRRRMSWGRRLRRTWREVKPVSPIRRNAFLMGTLSRLDEICTYRVRDIRAVVSTDSVCRP